MISAPKFWPASALEGDSDLILVHLEQSTPIRLIATLGEMTFAVGGERVAEAMGRAERMRFDFLPVRSSPSGPVIGLFSRADVTGQLDSTVQEVMRPLSGDNLIGADAPLLDFVFTADSSPCRLVLDRSEIRGLVTLSDLQRLPVRTALFGLFIHLELALTEVLRTRLGSGEGSCPSPWCSNGMLSSVDCSIRLPRAAS